MHARPVGVEDPRDLDLQPVLAEIVEEQRLGAALALVVAGTRADRVDVAPVLLGLRVYRGIAVDLGGRRLQDRDPQPLGEAEHVDRAEDAGLGGLHRIVCIVLGRGRAGEIVDLVDLDIERERHVMTHQLEVRIGQQMRDVVPGAGEEIVDAQHVMALVEQAFAQVRTEEPAPSGDQNPLSRVRHGVPLRPAANLAPAACALSILVRRDGRHAHLIARNPSKHRYFWIVVTSLNPARASRSRFPCVENGSSTPLRLRDFSTISSLEKPFCSLNSL